MIRFEGVSVTYADASSPAIDGVDLEVPEGELCVMVGRTGSGKSTLLRCVNGLVPHFSGGRLKGRVTVAGRDTRLFPPRELADVVGFVVQDPVSGFVSDSVEEELAYSPESLGIPTDVIRRRVEDALDFLGLAGLRSRPLSTLSGGQQQRVAIGAALTAEPRVLVLDEPTSALDPGAAEEVLGALHRLVHDVGVTVLVGEHRLERVVQYADRVVWLPGDGAAPVTGLPGEVLARSTVAPPVVRLGQAAGWEHPAVSIREARAQAGPLRERIGSAPLPAALRATTGSSERLRARGVIVRYPGCMAVRSVDLRVSAGERVALMGRNGSGKSSLLWALQGSGDRQGGVVDVAGVDPSRVDAEERRRRIGLVPQQPGDLLYLDTVAKECAQADRDSPAPAGTALAAFESMAPGVPLDAHPRDLSEGQRLGLALAVCLSARPHVMLLDEPTRGLDYGSKAVLSDALRALAEEGCAVLLATHDVEFVAGFATRVVMMAEGEIVADGDATEVITSSAMFAPQVAKVLAPERWTTVEQVERALAATAPESPIQGAVDR